MDNYEIQIMLLVLFMLINYCVAGLLDVDLMTSIYKLDEEIKDLGSSCDQYSYVSEPEPINKIYSISDSNFSTYVSLAVNISTNRFNEFIPLNNRITLSHGQNGSVYTIIGTGRVSNVHVNLYHFDIFSRIYYIVAVHVIDSIDNIIMSSHEWKEIFNYTLPDDRINQYMESAQITPTQSVSTAYAIKTYIAPPAAFRGNKLTHRRQFMRKYLLLIRTRQWLHARFNISYLPIDIILNKMNHIVSEYLCNLNSEDESIRFTHKRNMATDIKYKYINYRNLLITDINCGYSGECNITLLNPQALEELNEIGIVHNHIVDNIVMINSGHRLPIHTALIVILLCLHLL